ncbi:MAG: cytochrome c [Anaerolineales bacterium]|nr:cytochrome c [Anaerolineales bacterium]
MSKQYLIGFVILLLLLAGCSSSMVEPAAESATAAELTLGETIYIENCASCHGANLEGQADWKTPNDDGSFRSPPHDETGHTWHHDDGYLLERVRYGTAVLAPDLQDRSNMPAYEDVLTDEEISAVLAYIKSQWPDDIRQMQQERTDAVQGSN